MVGGQGTKAQNGAGPWRLDTPEDGRGDAGTGDGASKGASYGRGYSQTRPFSDEAMLSEVDLARALMLRLETLQLSPRAAVVVSVGDEAFALGVGSGDVLAALDLLRGLGYVDGPGAQTPGIWLFRKLTRRGRAFVEAAREPADWERIKDRQARLATGGGPTTP